MKVLIQEKLSPHKVKTPEGYLICQDAVLARTGPQEYMRKEIYEDEDSTDIIEVDRTPEQVFAAETLASFENKPLTCEHPDGQVTPENFRELAVGWVRDIHRGKYNGQDVMLGNLVVTDPQCIEDIENGERTDLSCGYDCDVTTDAHPQQINIRGNHVALCEQGRAGIARIIDSKTINDSASLKDLMYACTNTSGFKKINDANDILSMLELQTNHKYKKDRFDIDEDTWKKDGHGFSKYHKCTYKDSSIPVTVYTKLFATDSDGTNITKNETYFYVPNMFMKDCNNKEVTEYLNSVRPEVYNYYDNEFSETHGENFVPFARKYSADNNSDIDNFYFDPGVHNNILTAFIKSEIQKFEITGENVEEFVRIIKKLADDVDLIKYVDLSDGAIYITMLTHNESEIIPDSFIENIKNATQYIKNVMIECPTEHECIVSISFDNPILTDDSAPITHKKFNKEAKGALEDIVNRINMEAADDNKTYMDYESRQRLRKIRTSIRANVKKNINHFANELRRQ